MRKRNAKNKASKPAKKKNVAKKPATGTKNKTVKRPSKQNSEREKKKYEKPLIFRPVTIKKHRDTNGNHPHIILEDFENNYVSVGLTRASKKGRNATNYACEINPLGGEDKSYMRRQGTVEPKSNYIPPERKGKMSPKDFEKAKQYGDKAKQKYLEKTKKQ